MTEANLVYQFMEHLNSANSPWGRIKAETEFYYQRGRTDVVGVSDDGKVIAFEAKLNKWKVALQQAYRNRCFADISYVLLPHDVAVLAHQYHSEFSRRGVGICYLHADECVILHEAIESTPVQPWLRSQAACFVEAACDG